MITVLMLIAFGMIVFGLFLMFGDGEEDAKAYDAAWRDFLRKQEDVKLMTKPKTASWMARQGDVLIERIADIPAKAKEAVTDPHRVVLAYGEVTGHAHALYNSRVKYFRDDGAVGVAYIDVPEATEIQHEEHSAIPLEPGKYMVRRQREWTDDDEQNARLVAD